MNKQKSKLKELLEIYGTVILLILLFIGIGFIACAIVINEQLANEGRYDSIELQHQVMIEDNEEYKYCPYCGEELKR